MNDTLSAARDRLVLRRRISLPCQVVSEREFTLISDLCLDLSPLGMRVRALAPIALRSEVVVSFRVPAAGVHMDLSAVVARVARGRRRGESFASLGLSFVGISLLEGIVLSARLKGIPPPAPSRHLRVDYARAVRAIHTSQYC